MAFYKKFQSKLNDLWYPRAITTGIPITLSLIHISEPTRP